MLNYFQDIGVEGQIIKLFFFCSVRYFETLLCVCRLQEIHKMK